jgi:hypothetical protein
MSVMFYAWANPVGKGDTGFTTEADVAGLFEWADHTWVTTYDNREYEYKDADEVKRNSKQYWFCWGSFHPTGSSDKLPRGLIGRAQGKLSLAECLCEANVTSKDPDAQGTIFKYGLDGVCHQLANQVMWATGSAQAKPLTVKGSRAYWISNAAYSTYGVLHKNTWRTKCDACEKITGTEDTKHAEVDDFAAHVREALKSGGASTKAEPILRRREQLQDKIAELGREARAGLRDVTAEMINAEIRQFQQAIGADISPAEYENIFDSPPHVIFNVVDPAIYDQDGPH